MSGRIVKVEADLTCANIFEGTCDFEGGVVDYSVFVSESGIPDPVAVAYCPECGLKAVDEEPPVAWLKYHSR